jgi:hypothetical protein
MYNLISATTTCGSAQGFERIETRKCNKCGTVYTVSANGSHLAKKFCFDCRQEQTRLLDVAWLAAYEDAENNPRTLDDLVLEMENRELKEVSLWSESAGRFPKCSILDAYGPVRNRYQDWPWLMSFVPVIKLLLDGELRPRLRVEIKNWSARGGELFSYGNSGSRAKLILE